MRRVVVRALMLVTIIVPMLVPTQPMALADGDIETRIADFWRRVDAKRPDDLLSAGDIGAWALNLIERDRAARITVSDFRVSTAQMQVAMDAVRQVVASAPASPEVERRIALFWQRVDALLPRDYLSAADLGQWALNVTERDPDARILVADFRGATAGMQSAIDRAGRAATPAPPPASWTKTGPFPIIGPVADVVVDQTDAQRIYLSVENVGIVWTVDGGRSWRNTWCENPHALQGIVIDPLAKDRLHSIQNGATCVADLVTGQKLRTSDKGSVTTAGHSLLSSGGRVYVSAPDAIWSSEDQWLTSQRISGPGFPLDTLVIDPTDDRVMYGGSWCEQRTDNGRGICAGADAGVYKTTDRGATWSRLATPVFDVVALAIDPNDPRLLFASLLWNGDLYRSSDAGASWQVVNGVRNVRTLSIAPTSPATIWAGTIDTGLYGSNDAGATWVNYRLSAVAPASHYPQRYRDMVIAIATSRADLGTVYVGTGDGLFRLSAGRAGLVSVKVPDGPRGLDGWDATGWSDLAASPSQPSVVYVVDRCAQDVYRSEDGGTTWTPIGPAGSGIGFHWGGLAVMEPRENEEPWETHTYAMRVVVDPRDSGRIFVTSNAGVFASPDAGRSWSREAFKAPLGQFPGCPKCYKDSSHLHGLALDSTGSVVYAGITGESAYVPRGTSDGPGGYIVRSSDGGVTWTESSRGIPAPAQTSIYVIKVHPRDANVVYFGSRRDEWGIRFQPVTLGVYRSTSAGASWSASLANVSVNDLALHPDRTEVAYVAADEGLFKTTDGGITWSLMRGVPGGGRHSFGAYAVAIVPSAPSTIIVGFLGEGLFVSQDNGATWSVLNRDLTDVVALSIVGQVVYAATKYNGVYRGPLPSAAR